MIHGLIHMLFSNVVSTAKFIMYNKKSQNDA